MRRRTNSTWLAAALGLAVVAASGCEDDAPSTVRADGGDASAAGASGHDGGAGGTGGSSADAAVAGSGGSATDAAVAGSGGTDAAVACAVGGTNGQLTLAVQAPAGVTLAPLVRITGPMMASPIWLTPGTPVSLPAGPGYNVEYRRVKVAPAAGGLIGRAYTPSLLGAGFDACLRAGETRTITVSYALEPGSEKLWTSAINAPDGSDAAAFAPASLAASGTQLPTFAQGYDVARAQDLAIDAFGNLWVADAAKLLMFDAMKLGAAGTPAPDLVVTGAAVTAAQAIAFDAVGNLWVANGGATPTLDLISARDLATTAAALTATPAVTIASSSIKDPKAIAFDADGNLWIASAGLDAVVGFKPAHLAASAADAAPDTVLTARTVNGASTRTYDKPWSLAFDKNGNLWVGYNAATTIVRFALADVASVGAKLVDNPLAKSFGAASLKGLAFDETGGLWFSLASGAGDFGRLPASELTTSGEAHPDVLIKSPPIATPERLIINPVPVGLPIRD